MRNLTIPLALAAAATLAACGGHMRSEPTAYVLPSAITIVPVGSLAPRAGVGKIVYLVDPTGPVDGISTQFMTLKMEDGSTQVIQYQGHQFAMGANVQISSDNSIRMASN